MSNEVALNIKRKANLDIIYDNSAETKDIIVNERGGRIKFTREFVYLGSMINYLIDDTIDTLSQMNKASRAMRALKFIWNVREVPLITKFKLYNAIPLNLLLWGSEN